MANTAPAPGSGRHKHKKKGLPSRDARRGGRSPGPTESARTRGVRRQPILRRLLHRPLTAHTHYWDPGSASLLNQAEVIAGKYDAVTLLHGQAPPMNGCDRRIYWPGALEGHESARTRASASAEPASPTTTCGPWPYAYATRN
jgi:hypothetical protein